MKLEEFRANLETCSKTELIEMIIIQWKGLQEITQQVETGVTNETWLSKAVKQARKNFTGSETPQKPLQGY